MQSFNHTSTLEKLGFKLTSTCQCGRTHTEHWQRSKPLIIVEVKAEKNLFKIKSVFPVVGGTLDQLGVQVRAAMAREMKK